MTFPTSRTMITSAELMGTTFLSIIVPAHNAASSLEQCLEAVAASTYRHYECIVVDDGSSDDTAAVARRLADITIANPARRGPAWARNAGARVAKGSIILFIDADVCIRPDTSSRVVSFFDQDPRLDAVFGSYDDAPLASNFISQYKNLFHHFVHQSSHETATTFWSGCGAIRREVFLGAGGFDESYTCPCVEDVELGARLRRANHVVRLKKEIQVKHLKRWTFWDLIKSDIWDRGIPWTVLILKGKHLPNDLNLGTRQRISAVLAYILIPLLVLPVAPLPAVVTALSLLGALILINFRFYALLTRCRSLAFAIRAIPLHLLYYLYCGLALIMGAGLFLWRRAPR